MMSILKYRELRNWRNNNLINHIYARLNNINPECLCENRRCEESGKIVWNNSDGDYIHLRIDDCIIKDEPIKRCDCIIFYQDNENYIIIYIIEVAGRKNYHLSDIRDKISNCIINILDMIDNIQCKKLIIPVLYAKSHISIAKRSFKESTISFNGKRQLIKYLHYGQDIISSIT